MHARLHGGCWCFEAAGWRSEGEGKEKEAQQCKVAVKGGPLPYSSLFHPIVIYNSFCILFPPSAFSMACFCTLPSTSRVTVRHDRGSEGAMTQNPLQPWAGSPHHMKACGPLKAGRLFQKLFPSNILLLHIELPRIESAWIQNTDFYLWARTCPHLSKQFPPVQRLRSCSLKNQVTKNPERAFGHFSCTQLWRRRECL